ncbi:hypothetical protein BDP81DRAFT_86798 [Colletotrichum phormii]|uniref:Uncharacterized protein n=1 Tax=Colletotrichum phormii TaxID=359342 RepID=A0AAJ0A2C4_9PEZI|nr:uncharacterized protein BDP81DRAFT_86798 [Colletotrichum phormii]KAK1654668.1 hypothetical protein BDP81DRAFT_86798 [Colletotrichum phormii]
MDFFFIVHEVFWDRAKEWTGRQASQGKRKVNDKTRKRMLARFVMLRGFTVSDESEIYCCQSQQQATELIVAISSEEFGGIVGSERGGHDEVWKRKKEASEPRPPFQLNWFFRGKVRTFLLSTPSPPSWLPVSSLRDKPYVSFGVWLFHGRYLRAETRAWPRGTSDLHWKPQGTITQVCGLEGESKPQVERAHGG